MDGWMDGWMDPEDRTIHPGVDERHNRGFGFRVTIQHDMYHESHASLPVQHSTRRRVHQLRQGKLM